MEAVFTEIYKKKSWGKGSGKGSSPKYCKRLLEYLGTLLSEKTHLLDLGCGDGQLWEDFDSKGAFYTGVDIVQDLIDDNQDEDDNGRYVLGDFRDISVMKELLKSKPDIILIKDVFQHWEDKDIKDWLKKVLPLITHPCRIITSNNWRYWYEPEKNEIPRQLDNKYHWAPVDMRKFGFIEVFKYPMGKYKQVAVMEIDPNV